MEDRTLQIIDAFYSCTEDDCTAVIMDAHSRFADFMMKSFVTYTMCSLTNYSPDCATVLMQTLSPAFESGENIFTSLLMCAKLKSKMQRGNDQVRYFIITSQLCIDLTFNFDHSKFTFYKQLHRLQLNLEDLNATV